MLPDKQAYDLTSLTAFKFEKLKLFSFDGLNRAASDSFFDGSFVVSSDRSDSFSLAIISKLENISSNSSAGTATDAQILVNSNFSHFHVPPMYF